MKKHLFWASVFVMLALSACSIDKDYDLNKEVDLRVTVVPGATLPIGSLESVSIGPLVRGIVKVQKQVLKKTDLFEFDEGGNLCVLIDSSKREVEYLIDSVAIQPSRRIDKVDIPASFPPGWKSREIPVKIPMGFTLGTKGLGERISAVREVDLEPMEWVISFSLAPLKGFTLLKGTTIELPEWAFASETSDPFSLTSDHVLTLGKDLTVSSADSLTVPVTVNKLFVENGIQVPDESEMNLEGTISLAGTIRLSSADVTSELSGDVTLEGQASVNIPEGKFDEAEVILGETPVVLNLFSFPITLNLLTSYADLEPYDLECEFQVESRYPAGVDYSTILRIYNEEFDALGEFPLGSFYGRTPIHFPAEMNTSLYFSGSGRNAPEGSMSYKIDGLTDVLQNKESVMAVTFGSVEVSQDEVWAKVRPGVDYGFKVTNRAFMPLRLGKDASFSADKDIHGFGVDTTMALDFISPMRITMDAVNTIPVDLNLHIEMIDKDGNVVSEYSPVVKSDIKAGTLDVPSSSKVEIGFNTDKIVPFDGVRIEFSIGGGVMTNTPLNEKQAIRLKNIVLEVPEGVTVDPKLVRYITYLNRIKQDVERLIDKN